MSREFTPATIRFIRNGRTLSLTLPHPVPMAPWLDLYEEPGEEGYVDFENDEDSST